MNEYQLNEKRQQEQLRDELNSLDTGYTFKLRKVENDSPYFEVVAEGKHPVIVKPKGYDKRYQFFLRNSHRFTGYEDERKAREELGEPQKVGVLSKKKVIDWIEHLIAIDEKMRELSLERVQKVESFLMEAESEGIEVKSQGNDAYSGRIVKNGIEYSFTIESKSGYISQRVELYTFGRKNSLELFRELSSNQFEEKNEW